jgi:hypothetical protein
VNRFAQKVRSFFASPELLASSFDPRLCEEKNLLASGFEGECQVLAISFCLIAIFSPPFHLFAVAAPILPFIARITPGRFAPGSALARTVTGLTATNWQPSQNLGPRVLNR